MRKEVLFAILLGGIIGGVVAFGLWRANKALRPSTQTQEFTQEEAPKEETTKSSGSLTVTNPEPNLVVSTNKVKVEGASAQSANIVISTEDNEIVTQANEKGEFAAEIELTGGANLIKVTAIDKDGNKEEVEIAVVYSTELE